MSDMNWMDGLDGIDPLSVESEATTYNWVQWLNGSAQQKKAGGVLYTGGWFMRSKEGRGGWEQGEYIHGPKEITEGLFRRDLTVAVIAVRRRWITRGDEPQLGFPWDKYQEAKAAGDITSHMQALVCIRGDEDLGPVVLTAKGTVAHEFMGSSKNPNGVLALFRSRVIGAANDLSHKAGKTGMWPLRAFWLTVGPQRDDKGEPIFSEVGKAPNTSTVVFPTLLGTHDKMAQEEIAALYVGKEILTDLNRIYDEVQAWRTAWDTPSAPAAQPAPVAATVEGNPAAEEMPF